MTKAIFSTPIGDEYEVSDLNALKNDIIDNFDEYWMQGSGDGFIDYYIDDKKVSTLMLGPNIEYGLYLHIIDYTNKADLLSLYDKSRLDEVAETADEIYASVGLFLPKDKAWEGVKYFLETGKPLSDITWITPDDIPENGNW